MQSDVVAVCLTTMTNVSYRKWNQLCLCTTAKHNNFEFFNDRKGFLFHWQNHLWKVKIPIAVCSQVHKVMALSEKQHYLESVSVYHY